MAASKPSAPRIGARENEDAVAAGIDRGLHLADHLGGRDHFLSVEMPATLRRHLIFELDGAGSGALQHRDRAHHINRISEAGIGIDQQRQRHGIGDRGDVIAQLGERHEADIGKSIAHVRDPGAGHVDRRKAVLRDHAREQGVRGAREKRGRA